MDQVPALLNDDQILKAVVDAFTAGQAGQWLVVALGVNQIMIWALKKWGKKFLKRWNVTLNALFSASTVALAMMIGGMPWYVAIWTGAAGLGPDFVHQTWKNFKSKEVK